jgi:hydroxyacylglutathione hydrolase
MYQIETFVFTELQENCYLLHENGDAIIIDPGESEQLQKFLREKRLTLRMILNTHGHVDHICGNHVLQRSTGAKIAIGSEDAPMLTSPMLCGAAYFGWDFDAHRADLIVNDGDTTGYGGMQFDVLATPGHSPGSRSFYDRANKILFSGDLVFIDSVGRWDIPGADRDALFDSLRNKFLPLPDDVKVYPGHGGPTTVGREREMNPFLQQA